MGLAITDIIICPYLCFTFAVLLFVAIPESRVHDNCQRSTERGQAVVRPTPSAIAVGIATASDKSQCASVRAVLAANLNRDFKRGPPKAPFDKARNGDLSLNGNLNTGRGTDDGSVRRRSEIGINGNRRPC